ncbi:GDSL esterase/lipase CPRD49-like protein [Tanacetum coccineum]
MHLYMRTLAGGLPGSGLPTSGFILRYIFAGIWWLELQASHTSSGSGLSKVQPSLVVVYFGGNDSVLPRLDGLSAHVPLSEYVENMRKIAVHLKSLSEKTRIIFLTAPPVNEAQLLECLGVDGRKNVLCQKYADACVELCHEMGIKAINLCNAFKEHRGWMTTCFTDGIHLTPVGSKIVAKEILKVLTEADWKPSLHWESLPAEFA